MDMLCSWQLYAANFLRFQCIQFFEYQHRRSTIHRYEVRLLESLANLLLVPTVECRVLYHPNWTIRSLVLRDSNQTNRVYWGFEIKNNNEFIHRQWLPRMRAYLEWGSTARPRGLTKSLLIMTARFFGLSNAATSIVSFFESVQYNRRDIQSTATPSGDSISTREIFHHIIWVRTTLIMIFIINWLHFFNFLRCVCEQCTKSQELHSWILQKIFIYTYIYQLYSSE